MEFAAAVLGLQFPLVVLFGLGYLALRRSRRHYTRGLGFQRWAIAHGWYYDDCVSTATRPYGRAGMRLEHLLRGRWRGRDVVIREYRITHQVPNQENMAARQCTYVAVATPTPRPWLKVSTGKPLATSGGHIVEMESEEFNRAFHVEAQSPRFAYDVLNPQVIAWLLADPRRQQLPFRFHKASLSCWWAGELDVTGALWVADHLADLLDRVPDFVWRD